MMQCIEGEGERTPNGYGRRKFTIAKDYVVQVSAHRLVFEQTWGITIPDGMVVRHTCDNPGCVNPLHLQLGTTADNMRDRSDRGRHANQKKTHCPQGHEYSDGNTYLNPSTGFRQCRICHRDTMRIRYRDSVAKQSKED